MSAVFSRPLVVICYLSLKKLNTAVFSNVTYSPQADLHPEFPVSPPSGLLDGFTCLSLWNFKASMLHNP